MARTIRDITLALDMVVGPEVTDLRSLPMPDTSWTRSLNELHAPRKVGWAPTLGYAQVDDGLLIKPGNLDDYAPRVVHVSRDNDIVAVDHETGALLA